MFVSHYSFNVTPVLSAEASPNGPDQIRIIVSDGDYFYISPAEALAFAAMIRETALGVIATRAEGE